MDVRYMDDNLYEAATRGSDIQSYLTNELARIQTHNDGNNVLHVAAQHGNLEFINKLAPETLPEHYYDLLCKKNSKGETPLHLAAETGSIDVVNALVAAHDVEGVDSDKKRGCWSERDKNGDTPLHRALRHGHEKIAMILLEKDSQLVSVTNSLSESPAYLAADSFCSMFMGKILEPRFYDENNVSFSGSYGQNVFHPARKLNDEILSKLIERKRAYLKVQDSRGKTVLHYAVEENRIFTVRTLLKADSSLAYLHDKDGMTPLHRAAKMGSYSMIQTIIELSPQSTSIPTEHRLGCQTVLHLALQNTSCFEKCLQNKQLKQLINHADNDGNTPLHLALINSNHNAYKLLVVDGINLRMKNKQGLSPIELCKNLQADNKFKHYMVPIYSAIKDVEAGEPELRRERQEELKNRMKIRHLIWVLFPVLSLSRKQLAAMAGKELRHLLNSVVIIAAVIFTASFAAFLLVPGGENINTGQSELYKMVSFRVFIVADYVAMLLAGLIMIVYIYGVTRRIHKANATKKCVNLLQFCLLSFVVAFFSALVSVMYRVRK